METRVLLDGSGLGFGNARHLTLSFAPDATDIAGQPSALYSSFDNANLANVWQEELLRAFQTWAVYANINIGLVSDNGDAFGSPGLTLGDPRFGDIRIGATSLSPDVLAVAVSYDTLVSGTWAGDVLFNSSAALSDPQALFTVAMHEAGHVLGLGHSDDPNSPMFRHNGTLALQPTPEDIANLQKLYGARPSDANDGTSGSKNNSVSQATQIELPGDFSGVTPLVSYGDITSADDVDVFELEPPDTYNGPVTFQLRTSGISLLAARLTLLDKSGNILGQAESAAATGDVLTIPLAEMPQDSVIYAKVEGARHDVFGIGRYALITTFDDNLIVDDATIDAVARGAYESLDGEDLEQLFLYGELPFFNDDGHTDDEFGSGTELKAPEEFGPNIRYQTVGSLADPGDVDFYRFKSAQSVEGQPNAMTMTVRGLDGTAAEFQTMLYDTEGNIVPHEVLINHNGVYTIQVAHAKADEEYVLKVVAADLSGNAAPGNYNLDIGFGHRAYERNEFASGALSPTEPVQKYSLAVSEPQLFHFGLNTSTRSARGPVAAMEIFDAAGRLVYQLTGRAGQLRTGDSLLLLPGIYSVRLAVPDNIAETVEYALMGAATSQPIGPGLVDSTAVPMTPSVGEGTAFQHPYVWQPVNAVPQSVADSIPPTAPIAIPAVNVVDMGAPTVTPALQGEPLPAIQQPTLVNGIKPNVVPYAVPASPTPLDVPILPQETGAGDIAPLVSPTPPPALEPPVVIPQPNVIDLPTPIPSPDPVSSTSQLPQEPIVEGPVHQPASVSTNSAAAVALTNEISASSVTEIDAVDSQSVGDSVSRENLVAVSSSTNEGSATDVSGINVAAGSSIDASTVVAQPTNTVQRAPVEKVSDCVPDFTTAELTPQPRSGDAIAYAGTTNGDATPEAADTEAATKFADDAARLVAKGETVPAAVAGANDTMNRKTPLGDISAAPTGAIPIDRQPVDGPPTSPQQGHPSMLTLHSVDQAEKTIALEQSTGEASPVANTAKLAPQPQVPSTIASTHAVGDHRSATSSERDTADEVIGETPADESAVRWAWFDWRLILALLPFWGAGRRVVRRRRSNRTA